MGWVKRRGSDRLRWLVLALVVSLGLAACGGDDKDEESVPTGGGIPSPAVGNIANASPQPGSVARGNLPQDAETETVTIKDGKLDPDDVESQAGLPFVLVVEGDSTAHTLEIQGVVTNQQIPANQTTQVSFTVPEQETGTINILLDGKEAGTFSVQSAGGGTND